MKWGVICRLQATAYLDGDTDEIDIAAVGRRACETEYDLLKMLSGDDWPAPGEPLQSAEAVWGSQDPPSAQVLVDAVRRYLKGSIRPQVDERLGYQTRVAENVLGIVEREITLGAAMRLQEGERLRSLLGFD